MTPQESMMKISLGLLASLVNTDKGSIQSSKYSYTYSIESLNEDCLWDN